MTTNPCREGKKPVTAIVLAGGLGTRLRGAIADRPKVLAPAGGKPFLDYLLVYLAKEDIRQVILCVGYLADQVRAFAGDGRRWGLEIAYSEDISRLGTGGALRQASAGIQSAFYALNGDTLFMVDLASLWRTHQSSQAIGTIALLPVQDGTARGCVRLVETGKITAFDEKPPAVLEGQTVLVNGGVYLLEPQALSTIPPGQPTSIERQVFPMLAEQGRLAGQIQSAYFADIGTPESLAAFEQDLAAGRVQIKTGAPVD